MLRWAAGRVDAFPWNRIYEGACRRGSLAVVQWVQRENRVAMRADGRTRMCAGAAQEFVNACHMAATVGGHAPVLRHDRYEGAVPGSRQVLPSGHGAHLTPTAGR